MKSTVFANFLTFFLVSVQCSQENNDDDLSIVKTLEGLKVTNNPLSFSFNKKDYSGFKCHFNDEILTHELLMKPPFRHSISTSNFFSIFCYIFQYSEIIYDEKFKKIIESLFKCQLEKVHALRNSSDEFSYNPLVFKNHLVKLENKICKIISEQDNQFVNVEEKEERIFITPKESSKICDLKLIEEFVKDPPPVDSDSKIDDAMIDFFIKFNEVYLQDQLNVGYFKSLAMLIEIVEQEKNDEMYGNVEKVSQYDDSISELLKQFKNIADMMVEKKDSIPKTCTECFEKKQEEIFTLSFEKYAKIFSRKHISGELPTYLDELNSKVKTKVLLTLSEDCEFLDIFVGYSKEFSDSLFSLKNILFETFRDPKKIEYDFENLSNKSIESLVKNCLDMDI